MPDAVAQSVLPKGDIARTRCTATPATNPPAESAEIDVKVWQVCADAGVRHCTR